MKSILNEKFPEHQPTVPNSDIYRKFSMHFDRLLDYSSAVKKESYVEDPLAEQLHSIVNTESSKICCLVGFCGIGKTTLIKQTFSIPATTIRLTEDMLIIPSFWDGQYIDNTERILNSMCNVIHRACVKIDEFDFLFNADEAELQNFHQFIENTRSSVLAHLTTAEGKGLSAEKVIEKELDKTEKQFPLEYKVSQLKYLINKHGKIRKVLIIVDDIETLNEKVQAELLRLQYKIFDCLQNMPNYKLKVSLLMSMRPHSYRYFNNDGILGRQFESYHAAKHTIKKTKPVSIVEMFNMRFNESSKTSPPGNIETWTQAFGNLKDIVSNLLERYEDTLVDLCLSNIRAIMDSLKIILSNRTWCQKTDSPSEHPTVIPNDYDYNNIVTIIRAIACRNNPYYRSDNSLTLLSDNTLEVDMNNRFLGVPNILINPEDHHCDVLQLLIMLYMKKEKADADQYSSIKVDQLKSHLSDFFGDEHKYKHNAVIEYMFSNRIIRKSFEDNEISKCMTVLKDENIVFLTQKGLRLLKMLSDNSVLLEMYREDTVREYTQQNNYTSYEFVRRGDFINLYEDLLCMVQEIYNNEKSYFLMAQNRSKEIDDYADSFGGNFQITSTLLSGLEQSIRRSQNDEVKCIINKIVSFKERHSIY